MNDQEVVARIVMSDSKAVTNAVRQVLCNELGLTRDGVREMTRSLVEETVNKHVQRLLDEGQIEKMVKSSLEILIRNRNLGPGIHQMVVKTAETQVAEWVKANLRFNEQSFSKEKL